MIIDVIVTYQHIERELELSDTATALLVLAEAVTHGGAFSKENAENFGHELCLALKAVLADSKVTVNVDTPMSVDLMTTLT